MALFSQRSNGDRHRCATPRAAPLPGTLDEASCQSAAAVLREDSCAIDVGANEGAVLDSIVRLAPHGRHVAYEPIPALCERLAERYPAVDVRRAALSDLAGTTEFAHVLDAPAYSGLRERADLPAEARRVQRIPVRTERLDEALEEGYVPALIKIDVEGAELQVLRGALATLERHRPYVLFEHGAGGADLYGTRPHEVYELLDLGYGRCTMVLASIAGQPDPAAEALRRLGVMRVATKYPLAAAHHFEETGRQAEIVEVKGSVELAPLTGLVEAIVDLTATGTTLRENGLVVREQIAQCTARLIANPVAHKLKARAITTWSSGGSDDRFGASCKCCRISWRTLVPLNGRCPVSSSW